MEQVPAAALAARDPGVPGQRGEVDRPVDPGGGVRRRQDRVRRVAQERDRREVLPVAPRDGGVGERKHEVGLALPQQPQPVLRLGLHERQLDARVRLAQPGQRAREQRRAAGRERGEPHTARPQAGDRGHLLLSRVQAAEHRIRVLDERRTGIREPDAAAGSREQGGADLVLEAGDVVGDRGLGVAERPRRRRQRPPRGDGPEHLQAADVEHGRSRTYQRAL